MSVPRILAASGGCAGGKMRVMYENLERICEKDECDAHFGGERRGERRGSGSAVCGGGASRIATAKELSFANL